MIIAYDGTPYGGWQVQSNAPSIQSLVQNALSIALRTPTALTGSGRTDAGVHALGQTAHFSAPSDTSLPKLLASLNGLLPHEIRVLSIEEVEADFHARYSAKSKIYHYYLHLDPTPDPFNSHYAYRVPHPVDLTLLRQAANLLIGTHDFSAFANEASKGSAAKNGVRTLFRLEIVPTPKGVRVECEGNGFLYKMVRNIVGTLLDISCGKIPLEALPEILASKNRSQAGRTAPAHGLFLFEVKY
jgi:tRNA pseudouridine38-40 synthase